MKNIIAVIAYALLAVVASSSVFNGCAQEEKIKIGCISPFSGNGAVYGQALKDGFEIALNDRKKQDPDFASRLEIIYEDDKLEAASAVAAMQKLLSVDRVPVVIGAFTSNTTLAIAPMAEKNKVVLVTPTATNYRIKDAGDYVFRVCPSDALQGKLQAEYAVNILGAKTTSILYMNTDYGVGLQTTFQQTFEQLGGRVLSTEGFPQNEIDFRAQLGKIKQLKPDIIFMPSNWSEAANAVNQARQLKVNIRFVCTDGTYDPNFLELTKGSSEGLLITTMSWGTDPYRKNAEAFKEAFKNRFGREPGVYSALCYDALMIVTKVIKENSYNSESIRSGLNKVEYVGATGLTKFDSFGEVEKAFDTYQVENNKFVLISH